MTTNWKIEKKWTPNVLLKLSKENINNVSISTMSNEVNAVIKGPPQGNSQDWTESLLNSFRPLKNQQ
jgi:hypothetical protein